MHELVARLAAAAGIDAALAEKSLGIILAFLAKEVPPETIAKLMAAIPGAEEIAAAAQQGSGGGLMGLMGGMMGGGGITALGGQLMGAGLGMSEMQAIGHELFAFAAEKGGPDLVGEIAQAVPGLKAFL